MGFRQVVFRMVAWLNRGGVVAALFTFFCVLLICSAVGSEIVFFNEFCFLVIEQYYLFVYFVFLPSYSRLHWLYPSLPRPQRLQSGLKLKARAWRPRDLSDYSSL